MRLRKELSEAVLLSNSFENRARTAEKKLAGTPPLSERLAGMGPAGAVGGLVHRLDSPDLLEKLAALEHERWAGWMRYLFSFCEFWLSPETPEVRRALIRWLRQAATKYNHMPPDERESDRVEARKTLSVIQTHLLTPAAEPEKGAPHA